VRVYERVKRPGTLRNGYLRRLRGLRRIGTLKTTESSTPRERRDGWQENFSVFF